MFATRARAACLAFAVLIVFICIGAGSAVAVAANTAYEVKDLGTLGGDLSRARDINDLGQVVGESRIVTGELRAFLYQGGQMNNLATLGGPVGRAFGVNDDGTVVGESRISTTNNQLRAFLYENGAMRNLGTLLPTDTFSSAAAVNNSGEVVGRSGLAVTQGRAFLYQDGRMTDLGTLGGSYSGALNINNAGQVVGWASNADGQGRAFVYEDGRMNELGVLPGGSYAEARDINDSGQVVGTSKDADGDDKAFLYEDGQMKDLGTLGGSISNTHAINDFGQVVGWSPDADGSARAFIYEHGAMIDLNGLVPADSGWVLVDAFGINAPGQIVGIGTINDESHAFLLTPDDAAAPTTSAVASPEPNQAGWQKGNVTVTLDVTDEGGSNVRGITYSADGAQQIPHTVVRGDSARIDITAEGETTITYFARDNAGNTEEPQTLTVRLDKTTPEATIASPADGAEYRLGETVTADYACSDGGSGVDSCVGPVPDGGDIDTASVGPKIFTVEVRDRAGNVASASHSYGVLYDFDGFFRPVDNPDVLNRARAGRAIPVKFSLSGDQGVDVFADGYPKSRRIHCRSTAPRGNLKRTATAGGSDLSYDAALDRYNYVWKTKKAWAGTCRQLVVKLNDDTAHRATFKFR